MDDRVPRRTNDGRVAGSVHTPLHDRRDERRELPLPRVHNLVSQEDTTNSKEGIEGSVKYRCNRQTGWYVERVSASQFRAAVLPDSMPITTNPPFTLPVLRRASCSASSHAGFEAFPWTGICCSICSQVS